MSTTTTETSVRERPILFSAPMVRAIIEGRKTQTRRIVKTAPKPGEYPQYSKLGGGWHDGRFYFVAQSPDGNWPNVPWSGYVEPCPYGVPGERLWVREAFQYNGCETDADGSESWHIAYRADPQAEEHSGMGWRPSIHMPRWASRITLEITDVRVHKLQQITEEDAEAEGCVRPVIGCALDNFFKLWERINGEGAWASNPWIWALTFKVLP